MTLRSARFWLALFLGQIAVLGLLAWLGEARTPAPLRYLGIACIVGIFLTAPALMIKAFVSGQKRIGNAELSMVRGVERHEVALTVGAWVLMGAALAIAWPTINRDITAERGANPLAAQSGVEPLKGFSDSALRVPPGMTEGSAIPSERSESRNLHSPDAGAQDSVTTPGAGSPERAAILDALRRRLETKRRFRVDHIGRASEWAFVRATEVVQLEGNEEQETDLTVEALLEKPKASTTGWWRIADYWTLPENDQRPHAEFVGRVKQRIDAERLPGALLPEDF